MNDSMGSKGGMESDLVVAGRREILKTAVSH
jgi:hypothetical protein